MNRNTFRPLSNVQKLTEGTEHEISYTYDDLVFIEHSHILFQFSDIDSNALLLYINKEEDEKTRNIIRSQLENLAETRKIHLFYAGIFGMNQLEDQEEIKLELLKEV